MLAEELARQGHDISVYTTTANGAKELEVEPGKEVEVDGVKVTYFERVTGDHTHISTALWHALYKKVKTFDVVHIHSWWSPLIIGAALICKMKGIRPFFSPHGMLSTYIMETNNAGKKKWIHRLIGKSLLKNSILHVTAASEWEESKKIIPEWKGGVIPNLVKLSEQEHPRKANVTFTIGFLSRIDPKKGLDILIKALSKVNFDYKLLIAGDGDKEYMESLKALSIEVGNSENLSWLGWKNGEAKFELLAQLDLFALISHNENFAIVVIESLSVGTPVVISDNVGLYKYILNGNQGWVTGMDPEALTKQLNEIAIDNAKITRINQESPSIIKEEFTPSKLTERYVDLYRVHIAKV